MCYCPIAKEHCTNGRIEVKPNFYDECEFWDNEKGDCRIRRVLLQLSLKLEKRG